MWRGFSGQEDYDHDYGWHLWIWAPKSCQLHPFFDGQDIALRITDVQFFQFNYSSKHDYEVGVNIRVELHDTLNRLQEEYKYLEGQQFCGRYIGNKCDPSGEWRAVFEVDRDYGMNEEIIDRFDDISHAWEEDGMRALKSFTDAKDSHKGYDWDLWIWATDDCAPDSDDEDEEMTFTITRADLVQGSGNYQLGFDIEVE